MNKLSRHVAAAALALSTWPGTHLAAQRFQAAAPTLAAADYFEIGHRELAAFVGRNEPGQRLSMAKLAHRASSYRRDRIDVHFEYRDRLPPSRGPVVRAA